MPEAYQESSRRDCHNNRQPVIVGDLNGHNIGVAGEARCQENRGKENKAAREAVKSGFVAPRIDDAMIGRRRDQQPSR